jgi:hypothetical protein
VLDNTLIMKHHKDIFDLFRDSQHKLNERPSPEAWRRLERRLDNHRHRNRFAMNRHYGMVAAVVALVLLVTIFSLFIDKGSNRMLAINGEQPVAVEDLLYSDVDVEALKIVEFARQYQGEVAYPVREGSQGRKLVPTASKTKALSNANGNILKQLNWLEGTWLEGNGARKSLEKWRVVGNKKIEGTGLLMQGEEVLFEEKITIQESGDAITLKTYTTTEKKATQYQLKEVGYQWVLFENKAVDFPQQIIIQYDGQSTLSTLYQNPEPLNMNSYQMEYMNQRNQMVYQRALRQLRKVEVGQ